MKKTTLDHAEIDLGWAVRHTLAALALDRQISTSAQMRWTRDLVRRFRFGAVYLDRWVRKLRAELPPVITSHLAQSLTELEKTATHAREYSRAWKAPEHGFDRGDYIEVWDGISTGSRGFVLTSGFASTRFRDEASQKIRQIRTAFCRRLLTSEAAASL